MQYRKQEKFRLRKSKKYKNLCSVALGLTVATAIGLASDNQAHASENEVVKTENPATNNPEAKPIDTTEATENQSKENEKNGTIELTVDKSELDKVVEEAKNNGLTINQTEDKDLGIAETKEEAERKLAEAKQDYKTQAEDIKAKIEEYKKEVVEYEKNKNDYDKEVSDISSKLALVSEEKGLSLYGNLDESKRGSLDYYNYTLVNDENVTNADSLVGFIKWNNNTEITNLLNINSRLLNTQEENYSKMSGYYLSEYSKGSSFTITNVGTTRTGKNINLKVTFENDLEYIGVEGVNNPYIMIGKRNNDVIGFDFSNSKILKLSFNFVDDSDNPIKLAMGTIITDVDWGQGSKLEYSDYTNIIVPNISGLVSDSEKILYEKNILSANDDNSDIPFGSYFAYGIGHSLTYIHAVNHDTQNFSLNDKLDYDNEYPENSILFTLFGKGATVKQLNNPIKPTAPSLEYYYNKLYLQLYTNWVDEAGKELKPTEKGTFPDEEGDDIKGYEKVDIQVDKDGNVTNIYKKIPELTPKPEPKTPEKPKEEKPTPEKTKKELPKTNAAKEETNHTLQATILAFLVSILGMLGFRKKQQ